MRYISNTYGPVASFTGTPEARDWILTINATHFNESAGPATLPVSPVVSTNSRFYKFYNNKALFYIFYRAHCGTWHTNISKN